MRKWYFLILMLGLLLSACASGKPDSFETQPVVPGMGSVPVPADKATATLPPLPTNTIAPTKPPLTLPTSTAASKTVAESSEAMPGCTAKSLFPTPDPTAQALFPAVSETDWTRGPITATVTLIEYSDYQ